MTAVPQTTPLKTTPLKTTTPLTNEPLTTEGCHLDDLRAVLDQPTNAADYPHATEVTDGVLIYDAARVRDTPPTELAGALANGPGIVVVRGAFEPAVVYRASVAFQALIAEQHETGRASCRERVYGLV